MPGTMEHTVTLALFNAQQYINNLFRSKPSQPAIDNKIGVAAGATQATETGILGAVSSLPQSVTSAAVQVLKFVCWGLRLWLGLALVPNAPAIDTEERVKVAPTPQAQWGGVNARSRCATS